jgi:hypothetical protein
MNSLFIGILFAALGGIGGAGLITFAGSGSDPTEAAEARRRIIRPCYICLWGWGFLSAIEWWLLDFVNDHPAPIPAPEFAVPAFLGLVTGLAGATITRAIQR